MIRTRFALFVASLCVLSLAFIRELVLSPTDVDLRRILAQMERAPAARELLFYDAGGRLFDRHSRGNVLRRDTALEAVDPEFITDLIAVEDRDFFNHKGVDYRSIGGAATEYILGKAAALFGPLLGIADPAASRNYRGGSTLTQQLVKMLLNNPPRTPANKFHEAVLALRLEKALKRRLAEQGVRDAHGALKREILRQYLNRVYVDARVRGIGPAAKLYFNKDDLHRLSPGERVMLLALINGPRRLRGESAARSQSFLYHTHLRLVSAGRRRPEQSEPKLPDTNDYEKRLRKMHAEARDHPAQSAFVRSWLAARGQSRETPRSRARTISTYRDSALNDQMDRILEKYLQERNVENPRPGVTGAYILVSLPEGAVLAVGEDRDTDFNEAVYARRQISSTIKPFLYALALESRELTPASMFSDHRFEVPDGRGGVYAPGNNYHIFKGDLSLKSALEFSANTVSLRLLHRVGPPRLARLGRDIFRLSPREDIYTRFPQTYSLALGTAELSPAHLATGYLSLVTGGEKRYLRWSRDSDSQTGPRILSRAASYQVREMLTSVVRGRGTAGTPLQYSDLILKDLGGKTGSSPRDSWFVGYSRDLLLVTWIGFRSGTTPAQKNFSAALLWKDLFHATVDRYPPAPLGHPAFLKRAFFCRHSGLLITKRCRRIQSALFEPGTEPSRPCNLQH